MSEQALTEREKERDWRLHCLLDAGFSPQVARIIANRRDIDLHRAVELAVAVRARGLDIEVAADILL